MKIKINPIPINPDRNSSHAALPGQTWGFLRKMLNLKKLLLWADTLPEKQLNQVIDALAGLKASKTPDTVQEDSHPSGSIEYKMINGCGPYRYLRYWSGGRYRSVYLGKPES